MKTMKKALALVLALSMILALCVTAAFAADTTEGSITINNAVVGQTYTIYEILYLESYNKDAGAYAYKATADWSAFINSDGIKGTYVNVDDQGYVTWVEKADAAAFAKLAQAYAAEHNINNQGTEKAETATVKFTGLNLGYYLVDSSLGTLCSLDTTNPDVDIKEKNAAPTTEKEVQENSTGTYGKTNDANIGDTVNFKTTINVLDGDPTNYVLHDKMSAGLTFRDEDAAKLTVKIGDRTLTAGPDYTLVTTGLTDDCTFEVRFGKDVLKPNDVVVVSYSALLNSSAVIAGKGNLNETHLSYTDENNTTKETTPSTTRTYTWQVDVFKYTKNGEEETPLAGAKFVLSKTENEKTFYVQVDEDNKVTGWTEDKAQASVFTTPENGKFSIAGLDAGTYYLEEIEAPAGYNMLKDPIEIRITAEIDEETNVGTATVAYGTSNGEVKVENNTGAELPSTGGIGTTIFYVLGALLVVFAGVMLVTKKRMSKEG